MTYIPREWIKNKDNEDKVHDLLNQLDCDLKVKGENIEEEVLKELSDIGEIIIIEKYKSGQISFGA